MCLCTEKDFMDRERFTEDAREKGSGPTKQG